MSHPAFTAKLDSPRANALLAGAVAHKGFSMEGSQQTVSGKPPATVFVSYSRVDQKRARPVIDLLESAGFSVWWDGLLEGGERFSQTTETALETARAVVVLWSKTSTASHWVHDEATRGRDRSVLVPISLDGSDPPLGFRQFQTIDISKGRLRAEADRIVHAVAALHDQPAPPAFIKPRGIDRRIALAGGAGLLVAGSGAAWWAGLFGGTGATANSVAVLPFVNLSGDPAQTYFSDGLSAEVRSELARNNMLQVAAQSSSNQFRERSEGAKAISRKLGVVYLLDGNVRKSAGAIRISAELIDGRSGFSQWSQTFDRPLTDVFAVQDEIAEAVASALTAQVSKGTNAAQVRRGTGATGNVAAYDAYLRGKDLFDQAVDEATDRRALALFEDAITLDPGYGAAHAARARVLAVIANQYAPVAERRGLYDDAIASARRAVELAPRLAEAFSALGFVLHNGRLNARVAREPYDRSYALGTGDADVLSRFAVFCGRTGRFGEARAAIAKASALDRLNPRTYRQAGEIAYVSRRYAEAIPPLRRALELNPKMGIAHSVLGASLLMLGKNDEARAEFERETSMLVALPGQAIVALRQDRTADAQRLYTRLIAEVGDIGLYQQAQVLAQWNKPGEALAALERARLLGDAGLVFLRNDPFLDPLRREPEFSRLLSAMGFD